jgi:hypothetical protein
MLIPTRSEYKTSGFQDALWYGKTDLESMKEAASAELMALWRKGNFKSFQEIIHKLYQPSSNDDSMGSFENDEDLDCPLKDFEGCPPSSFQFPLTFDEEDETFSNITLEELYQAPSIDSFSSTSTDDDGSSTGTYNCREAKASPSRSRGFIPIEEDENIDCYFENSFKNKIKSVSVNPHLSQAPLFQTGNGTGGALGRLCGSTM